VMLEQFCAICGSSEFHIRLRSYGAGTRLLECLGCGFCLSDPMPKEKETKDIYRDADYFANAHSLHRGYEDYEGDSENIRRTFTRRFLALAPLLPHSAAILDVGCAYGYFLDIAASAGHNVQGIDPSPAAIAVARERHGDKVREGTLGDSSWPAHAFDLVTMWDVLEHTLDPRKAIVAAARLLRPGGILAITVPDSGSIPARVMGRRWMGYKPGEHPIFFSRSSLQQVLDETGFTVEAMRHEGKFVSGATFLNRLAYYFPLLLPITQWAERRAFVRSMFFYVNPFDILLVVAKKRP